MISAKDIDLSEFKPNEQNASHRGPEEAGSADRYYGRRCKPNFSFHGHHFTEAEMTPEQVRLYTEAWESETDRKTY